MKINELIEGRGNGIEHWTIHNAVGVPKKFKKIDGWWEKPSAVKAWMTSSERPLSADERREIAAKRKEDAYWEKQERDEARAKAAMKRDTWTIWNKFETAVGNSFPDGDFIDHLGPWMRQHDLSMDDVDAAVRKHSGIKKVKGAYDYMAIMWDDYAADAQHDAEQGHHGETYDHEWFTRENPWK